MQWFVLAALALAAAAVLWYTQAVGRGDSGQPSDEEEETAFQRWLEESGGREALCSAVAALCQLMAHPELGGPGFLTVRLPQPGEDGAVTVTAQYPNIRERLYRRIVRQELDREALRIEGVPGELLALEPAFETDSGGVVVISVRVGCIAAELVNGISGRTERQKALRLLAECLGSPAMEAKPFGAELLLTPVREGISV